MILSSKGDAFNLNTCLCKKKNMEHHLEGSACGRFVYGVITENGVEIDRYLEADLVADSY